MARINPIAKQVKDVFAGAEAMITTFVTNPNSAISGLILSGDAGTGKTHVVKTTLVKTGYNVNAEYLKGGKITAANLYVKLYLNRQRHRILVIDDVDIVNSSEKQQIVPMLLGAVELGKDREVSWETAKPNAMMKMYGVPNSFAYNGNLIWITNDTRDSISLKLKQWHSAILGRFNFVECSFNIEQKFMYTMHLIENEGLLGANCKAFDGGYPDDIVEEAVEYMSSNYRNLVEVTPRQAIKIADILNSNSDPSMRNILLQQLWK